MSVVGLGCNQLGTKSCNAATADQIVHEALDAGITYFDTSDEYGRDYADPSNGEGWGRSEELLGKALGTRRETDEVDEDHRDDPALVRCSGLLR